MLAANPSAEKLSVKEVKDCDVSFSFPPVSFRKDDKK